MHSLRRAALRVAVHGSKAVVAMPRVAWAPKAPSPCTLPSVTVAFSRSFVATPRLANQVEDADKESNTQGAEAAAGEASFNEAELLKPENTAATQSGAQNAGTDTPYGLFVRNLIFDANEEHLRDAFAKYGQITKVAIARDARGLSRGYAFVFFTNADDMNKAAAGANGSFWHGRRIHAAPRIKSNREDRPKEHERLPLSEKTPTHSLYIGNIPYETTDAELNTMFRALDNVTDVRIAVDRSTGWPRGFAHADFSTPEAAMKAALKLESTTLLGRTLRIDFSQHTKRDLQKPRQERVSKSPSGNGGSIA